MEGEKRGTVAVTLAVKAVETLSLWQRQNLRSVAVTLATEGIHYPCGSLFFTLKIVCLEHLSKLSIYT